MADGSTKRICDVQVGDQVLSRDPQTDKVEAKTVTNTIERHAPSVVDVTLHDARTGKAETLTCTPEHPWYTVGGWVLAGNLSVGTSILTRAGPSVVVASAAKTHSDAGVSVYNFIVQDDPGVILCSAFPNPLGVRGFSLGVDMPECDNLRRVAEVASGRRKNRVLHFIADNPPENRN